MARTQPVQQSATEAAVEQAKKDLLDLQPRVIELKERLKALSKEKKTHLKIIEEYMSEKNLHNYQVGPYSIELKESESCPFNEKNLKEILSDHSVIDTYKETFTTRRTGYRMSKPRRSTSNNDV